MASKTTQTKRNRKILTMLLRSATISMQKAARPPSYHEPVRPGLHMRHRRYHSKPVLTDAFGPGGCRRDRTKCRSDERIVAGCGTLYSKDREKPPFADRAPRPVGQCDASPRDRQLLGCRRAGSQRRAIRTLGTRSRYKAPLTRP